MMFIKDESFLFEFFKLKLTQMQALFFSVMFSIHTIDEALETLLDAKKDSASLWLKNILIYRTSFITAYAENESPGISFLRVEW